MPVIMMTSIDTLYEVTSQDANPIQQFGSPHIEANFHGLTQIALQNTSSRIQDRQFAESTFKQQQQFLRDAAQVAVNIFNPVNSLQHRYRASVKLTALTGELQAFDDNSHSSGLAYTLALALSWGCKKNLFTTTDTANSLLADIPIFATGCVPVDCYAKPVGHILKKVRYACEYIKSTQTHTSPSASPSFYIIIPKGNLEELNNHHELTQTINTLGGQLIAIGHLSEALHELIGEAFDGGIFTNIDNGFAGLNAISYEQRHLFMGREELIRELYQKSQLAVEQKYVLNITGVSGSGKSSAVMAGLVPRLLHPSPMQQQTGESSQYIYQNHWTLVRPSQFSSINDILYELLRHFSSDETVLQGWLSLSQKPETLIKKVKSDLLRATTLPGNQEDNNSKVTPHQIWVIDQYEEAFTHTQITVAEAQKLFPLLALFAEHLPVLIITVLRTEYLGTLGGQASIDVQLPRRIQAKEIEHIIALQLQYHRLQTESAKENSDHKEHHQHLDNRIKNDAIGKPLTTVSYLLQQMHHQMIKEDASATLLTHHHYDAVGGINGVMAQQAELALKEGLELCTESERKRIIHSFFDAFIGIDNDQNPIAKALPNAHINHYPEKVNGIIQAFMAKGLIIDCGRASTPKIKLAHDTLLPSSNHSKLSDDIQSVQWERLAHWFEQHKTYLLWKQDIEPLYLKWLPKEEFDKSSPNTITTYCRNNNRQYLLKSSHQLHAAHDLNVSSLSTNIILKEYLKQSRQARLKQRLTPLLVLFLTLFIAGTAVWDHYFRVKVYHAAFIGERYDIPFAISELNHEQVKAKQFHYKLQYQKGLLKKLSRHNSYGALKNDVNRGNAALWNFSYTEDGTLLKIESIAQNGKPLESKTYEFTPAKNIAQVRFKTHGTDTEIGDIVYQRAQFEGQNKRKSEITQHRLEFNKQGYTITRRFFNNSDQPAKDATGAYGIRYYYDQRGLIIRLEYIDMNGNVVSIKGVHAREYTRDFQGNITAKTWLNDKETLTLNQNGYAQTTTRFDRNGNLLEKVFLESQNNIAIHKHGFSKSAARYDQYGNQIEQQFLDKDNQLTLHKWGFAKVKLQYDNRGNAIEWAYFDENNQPALRNNRFHIIRFKHDQWGNRSEESYFDINGNPTLHSNGYARFTASYDDRGNRLSESYFDIDGQPVANKNGYAKITATFNKNNQQIGREYFNTLNQLTLNQHGYASYRAQYDLQGNRTDVYFFGIDKKPILNRYGFAHIATQYNQQGNKTNIQYFDTNEEPTLHQDGIFRTSIRYNAKGDMIEAKYFDKKGHSALKNNNFARITLQYDDRGNRTGERYYGIDNEPIKQKNGYAQKVIRYDDRNNPVEWEYLDTKQQLTLNQRGYARFIAEYNTKNDIIGTAYFDAENNLLKATGVLKN